MTYEEKLRIDMLESQVRLARSAFKTHGLHEEDQKLDRMEAGYKHLVQLHEQELSEKKRVAMYAEMKEWEKDNRERQIDDICDGDATEDKNWR